MRSRCIAGLLLGFVAFGLSASAATVTYNLDLSVPGEFRVYGSVSTGDNYGLVAYALPFAAETAAMITDLQHISPGAIEAINADFDSGAAGFTLLRNKSLYPNGSLVVHASQDTIAATPHLIRGFGQSAGSFSDLGLTTLGLRGQAAWGDSILLAQGTYAGDIANFQMDVTHLAANVFADSIGARTIAAEVHFTDSNGFSYIPPPLQAPIVSMPPVPPSSDPVDDSFLIDHPSQMPDSPSFGDPPIGPGIIAINDGTDPVEPDEPEIIEIDDPYVLLIEDGLIFPTFPGYGWGRVFVIDLSSEYSPSPVEDYAISPDFFVYDALTATETTVLAIPKSLQSALPGWDGEVRLANYVDFVADFAAFGGTTNVPEPSSAFLVVSAIGLIGRRRRQ